MKTLKDNDYKLKPYFSILVADARLKFKVVSFMTPSVKMDLQSDKKFAAEFWACEGCLKPGHLGMRDTQHQLAFVQVMKL